MMTPVQYGLVEVNVLHCAPLRRLYTLYYVQCILISIYEYVCHERSPCCEPGSLIFLILSCKSITAVMTFINYETFHILFTFFLCINVANFMIV